MSLLLGNLLVVCILILPSSTIYVPSARQCRCNMHLPLDCYFLNRKNFIDIYTWTRQSVYCNSNSCLSNTSIPGFYGCFFSLLLTIKLLERPKKKVVFSNIKMDIKLSSTTYYDNLPAVLIPKLSLSKYITYHNVYDLLLFFQSIKFY